MQILAIIPARGGSKGIHRKNIKPLAGKPLIQYSIEAAQQSSYITDIVVSTDDDEIVSIVRQAGGDVVMRPEKLARDDSLVMDAVRHVIDEKKKTGFTCDVFILLEPTAPFRTPEDIDNTVDLLRWQNADSAATFSETDTPPTRIWRFNNHIPEPFIEGSDPFLPRQAHPKGYILNGMVYVMKTSLLDDYPDSNSFLLGKTVGHIIPSERVVDIDTEFDFLIAEQMLKAKDKD